MLSDQTSSLLMTDWRLQSAAALQPPVCPPHTKLLTTNNIIMILLRYNTGVQPATNILYTLNTGKQTEYFRHRNTTWQHCITKHCFCLDQILGWKCFHKMSRNFESRLGLATSESCFYQGFYWRHFQVKSKISVRVRCEVYLISLPLSCNDKGGAGRANISPPPLHRPLDWKLLNLTGHFNVLICESFP